MIEGDDGAHGSAGSDPARGMRRLAGRGRRVGLALTVAAAFVFGVLVGRSGLAAHVADGAAPATTTTSPGPSTGPATASSGTTRTSRTRSTSAPTAPTSGSAGIPAGEVWSSVDVGDGEIRAAVWVGGRQPGLVVLERGYLAQVFGGRLPYVVAQRRVDPQIGDPAR